MGEIYYTAIHDDRFCAVDSRPMRRYGWLLLLTACGPASQPAPAVTPVRESGVYYPPPGESWQHLSPSAAGFDSVALAGTISFAQASEINWSLDMQEQLAKNNAREPFPDVLGPFKNRGRQNGIILRHGYIVAEWGDTRRVDMTFSVAKSYLSSVAG